MIQIIQKGFRQVLAYQVRQGQTLVEYALIIGFLVIVVIASLQSFANPVKNNFSKVSSALQNS